MSVRLRGSGVHGGTAAAFFVAVFFSGEVTGTLPFSSLSTTFPNATGVLALGTVTFAHESGNAADGERDTSGRAFVDMLGTFVHTAFPLISIAIVCKRFESEVIVLNTHLVDEEYLNDSLGSHF